MTFLQQLSQAILQRDDIPLKDTLIVLPNKRARRMLQKELASGISQPCFSPTIFSIDEFIRKLSDYTLCEDIDLLHILFKAYQEFEHAKSEKLSAFLSWAETFIHDISEIDMQLADASKIFGNLSDIKELETVFGREKLTDSQQRYLQFYATLHNLYRQFNSFLDEEKLAYEGKIYKDTAENIIHYAQKFNFKRYIFAGFQTLSPSEMEIVRYYHQEHQAEFYFDIDKFYQENYTPFITILQNKLKIKELKWIHTDYASIPKQINIVGASKSMNQILYAIEQLNHIEQEEGNLNDTVLVFADEKLLTPFIHCYDCGKANLTMGYPLNATPAYALLSTLMETARNSQRFQSMQQGEFLYYHRDVFSFFRNPLIVNHLFPDTKTNKQFLKGLTDLNSIFFPLQTLDFSGHTFPNLSGNPVEIMEEILNFFTLLTTLTADDKAKHFDHYCLNLILDKLQQALNHIREFDTQLIDLESSFFILKNLIQHISIPLKGSPSEGLQIMGLLETRALDFKNIIMLSLNEGTLPAGRSSNSLILHEVKKYFNLPTYQEKDTVYGYHFFRLLQRAEQVHLLYNTDSNTALAEKSRFLKQLDFEVKAQGLGNIHIHELVLPTHVNTEKSSNEISIGKNEAIIKQLKEKQYSYSHLNDYLNCPLQFYLKHIAHIEPADDISESVEQKLIGDAIHHLMDKIGQELIAQPAAYPQIIEDTLKNIDSQVEAAMKEAILGDRGQGTGIRGQGSGVRDQVEGRRWKVEGDLPQESGVRGQGTGVSDQETVRGIQNSSLIPLLLEGVAEGRGSDANIIQNSKYRIQNTNEPETVNCQLSTVNPKIHIDLTHGKSYLATEVVKKAVIAYLKSMKADFEKAEKQQYSFKIIATEQKMTCTINVDQNPIQLKGYADRIDFRNGLVTLLDYKTGFVNDKGLSYEKFDDIFTGTEHKQLLQLLMYAYLYERSQRTGTSDQESVIRGQGSGDSEQGADVGMHNAQWTMHNAQCTMHNAQCTMHNAQWTMHNAQWTMHNAQCTMHNVQCTMYNEDGLSTETCKLKPENCQLSTVNYLCGIISFQRMYQKKPHELYPIFQESGDNNQGTGVSDQESGVRGQGSVISDQETVREIQNSGLIPLLLEGVAEGRGSDANIIQNSKKRVQNTCEPETVNCQLSTVNSTNLITPEILRLFEKHLINLLRDIINPKQPFCQTDDVNHCVYCDYSAICKRQNTKDE